MALRAGYYGLKKKIVEKVNAIPGIKEIGSGLNLSSSGTLTATGGGAVYTAGTGIDISEENVISVDDTVVPDMQDLAGKVGYLDLEYVSGVNYLDISKAEIGVDRFGEADADKARLIIPVGYITQPAESIHFWFMIKGTDTLDAIDLYKNNAHGASVDLKTESPYECVIAPAWTELIIEFEKTSISMQDLTDLGLMLAPSVNIPYYRDFTPNDYILEATKVDWSSYAKTGVHNNFSFPYYGGAADGGTFTVNADKTLTAIGTFTGNSEYIIKDYITDNRYEGWIISSNAEYSEDFYIRVREALSDGTFVREIRETNGQIVIPHMDSGHKYYVGCRVGTTGSAINVTLKPTLSVPDDTYKGYTEPTMSNKELTEKVFIKREITSADDLDNIIEVGVYSIKTSPTHAPDNESYVTLLVTPCATLGSGAVVQTIFAHGHSIYSRTRTGNPLAWESWYKFTGTVVS